MTHQSRATEAGLERRRALAQPLAAAVTVHALLAMLQFGAAWITESAGIMASAMHVSIGATAHLFALRGIWISTRPPDDQHPYGCERFESLSALVIGQLLLAAVTLIAVLAFPRLLVTRHRGGQGRAPTC